jgi:hypothetical protein
MRASKGKLRLSGLKPQPHSETVELEFRGAQGQVESLGSTKGGDTTVVGLVAQRTTAPGASPSPASCLYVQMLQGSLPPATRNVVLDVFRKMRLVGVTFVEAQYLLAQLGVTTKGQRRGGRDRSEAICARSPEMLMHRFCPASSTAESVPSTFMLAVAGQLIQFAESSRLLDASPSDLQRSGAVCPS